jgi:TonB dependent receptor-like, beta-barrel
MNVTLAVAGITESVTVVASAEPFTQMAQVATKFPQDLMSNLPSNRTLEAAVLMASSVHATGPGGAFSIAGAPSFENPFAIDGVVVVDSVRGTVFPVFIEDAIQETTIATSGISAEYGRFTGGVVNVVTKSGGNLFGGSYRQSFNNDNWSTTTPFKEPKLDEVVPTYEYTFGGPAMKDRLWFFTAGRFLQQKTAQATAGTNLPYERNNAEKRYELALTYSPTANHTLKGSFGGIRQVLKNFTQFNVMDLQSLGDQHQDNALSSLHYTGTLHPNLFVEAQYSRRDTNIAPPGARATDLINGTLLIDNSRGFRYWSPTFCHISVCDPERRDNGDIVVKGSYFLSTRSQGTHNLVFGYDRYRDVRQANTHQSGSDYRIMGTTSIIQGTTIYPVFLSNTTTTIVHLPILTASEGTSLATHSLFVNDEWRYSSRLTFNVGLRWDRNQGKDGGKNLISDDSKLGPRLAVVWDPVGDGRWTASGSVARYVAALNSSLADLSPAGNVSAFRWVYTGPPLNADPSQPLVPAAEAIRQVFDWLSPNGVRRNPDDVQLPGINVRVNPPLKSPSVDEYAIGISRQIRRGSVRADFVYRDFSDFYATRVDMTTGRVQNELGQEFDLSLQENTNVMDRKYKGLTLQSRYRVGSHVDLGAAYTLSQASGNFDAETANAGPMATLLLSHPEYKQASWNSPDGDLSIDQRHRARIWGTYQVPIASRAGSLSVGVVQQFNSGIPYSAVATLDPRPYVLNPGYLLPPVSVDYYFSRRGAFRTESSYRTDLAINYAHKISAGDRSPEFFFHSEVLNVFNKFQLCGCGDTVFNNGGKSNLATINQGVFGPGVSGMQTFNPFTQTPVEGVNWSKRPNFGTAVSRLAYTMARTFRFSVGLRF